ncbi:restriction endonuclease [Candidatus Bathyarchaeota archaeon]|nr:restriction endonuclease [Candidatus Bathyarchaeota archaeon]
MDGSAEKGKYLGFLIVIVLFALIYNIILGLALIACLIVIGYWWFKKKYLIRVSTINELMNLSPSEFERAIAALLMDLGYRNVKVTGGAGDLGRDITCKDGNSRTVMVQCKR